ncbi:MAG: HlyD family efflux transporter periplasmic adaptor subunit, partial [Candidatus Gottesmanbacteria bacterium]|nr:HlyD family efflux transporter periplasmic adaptor subunit [Candidatus Gottesmanbacteria bacterium]
QKTLDKALRDYSSERNDFEEMWRVTYNGVQNPNTALTDTVKRILQKNQWDLDKAVLDVELKNLAVEYATLVTPIAGIVAHIDTLVPGVNITPATAVFEIVDPTSLVFAANIDEVDIGSLSLGQTASVALDAFPDATFSAKVSYISYISETSAGGATVFPVKIAFDEPQKIRIGLNGDVTIQTTSVPDAAVVPIEAIREQDSGKFVYKKTGTSYTLVPVTTGEQNDTEVVITGGISAGDVVVIKGFSQIPKTK